MVPLPVPFVALGNMVPYQEIAHAVQNKHIKVTKEKPPAMPALVDKYQTNKQLVVKNQLTVSHRTAML